MKKIILILSLIIIGLAATCLYLNLKTNQVKEQLVGAVSETFERNFYPQTDNTYTLGSSTLRWNAQFYSATSTRIVTNDLTILGTCTGCGGTSVGGSGIGTSSIGYLAIYDTVNTVTGTPISGISINQLSGTSSLAYLANTNIFTGANTFASSSIASANIGNLNVTGTISGISINQLSGTSSIAYLANANIFTSANTFASSSIASLNAGNLTVTGTGYINSLTVGTCSGCGGGASVTGDNTWTGLNIFNATTTHNAFASFTSTTIVTTTITNANITNLVVTSCTGCGGGGVTVTGDNNWTGLNVFNATSTFSTSTFARIGINSSSPSESVTIREINGVDGLAIYNEKSLAVLKMDSSSIFWLRRPQGAYAPTTTPAMENQFEPFVFTDTGVANFTAMYSDDVTRILTMGTAAGAAVTLHRNHLSSAATAGNATYVNNVLQTVTAATMFGVTSTQYLFVGAITHRGYHYVAAATTTLPGTKFFMMRATSTYGVDIAKFGGWATTTLIGGAVTNTSFMVGAATNSIYIAVSATQVVQYNINNSANTLTAVATTTVAGAGMNITNTRVNETGIYAGFGSAPFVRKYNFAGVLMNDFGGQYQAAPATTGPDLFVMRSSAYGICGTAQACKFIGL